MTFFPLHQYSNHIALIDGDQDQSITYSELDRLTKALPLPSHKTLIFLFNQNHLDDVVFYVAALNAGHVVCLLDAKTPLLFKQQFAALYSPEYIYDNENAWSDYETHSKNVFHKKTTKGLPKLHPHLQLLLSTSGNTGNPKLIRLSKENLLSNAASIIEYLTITSSENAIASLPFHYSYGLSVLHTHLLAGATITLTQSSVVQEPFWQIMQHYACTSLAGVPYTYQLMDRMGFDKIDLPTLRTLTQAGGKLDPFLIKKFSLLMHARGGSFFTMYGQSEATARIAYLPPEYLPGKAGSIGRAIPKGTLQIMDGNQTITKPYQNGELVYQGPNVMLGYAKCAEDLQKEDELHGILHTEDIGYFDEDGLFFLTGRAKRISKIYGLRINLDDIEQRLMHFGNIAVTSTETKINIYIENISKTDCELCIKEISEQLKLHPSSFSCISIREIPRTASGKIDYQKL